MQKNILRELNKAKRNEMEQSEVFEKSFKAAQLFLKSVLYKNARCIMLYKRLGNETDTESIITASLKNGKRIVFPVTENKSGVITPYYADENTVFEKGNFSVSEPKNAQKAEISDIDVVLVPGIAFDKKGTRVGFGKGCYDMFLKNFKGIKTGFCYDFQVEDKIIGDEHDINMDFIITENAIYRCKGD